MSVHILLEKLGFTRNEIEVYLAILRAGKTSATEIAKQTGVNRTTVYSVARELLKKGVIRQDLGKGRGYFFALPPAELHTILEREERRLTEKKHMIQNVVAQLEPLMKSARYSVPQIVFVEEDDLEPFLYKQNEKWARSIMEYDGIWWGFQDHTFVEHYHNWIEWSWKQPFQSTMHLRLLTNQSDIEAEMRKKKLERRLIKFWRGEVPFTGTMWVNGDYLILIVTNVHPHYLVEIHDRILASNMRTIFGALWNDT